MLRETVSLHQSLGIFREHTAGLTHVLENLDCAMILLDAAQRPVFMNTRARDVAQARDGLLVGRCGLTTARTGETRSLQRAIASAVEARPACSASVYVHRDAARTPLKLDILPVGGGAGTHTAARVIVLIREPEAPRAFDREALARSYDLTPREAELAILLATGHTLSGAAATLKIGLSTVRWYLKHLFEKTETHRQGELIRLVVGGFASRSA
jgi:DNA-binding CsgD family transcriptional regulator